MRCVGLVQEFAQLAILSGVDFRDCGGNGLGGDHGQESDSGHHLCSGGKWHSVTRCGRLPAGRDESLKSIGALHEQPVGKHHRCVGGPHRRQPRYRADREAVLRIGGLGSPLTEYQAGGLGSPAYGSPRLPRRCSEGFLVRRPREIGKVLAPLIATQRNIARARFIAFAVATPVGDDQVGIGPDHLGQPLSHFESRDGFGACQVQNSLNIGRGNRKNPFGRLLRAQGKCATRLQTESIASLVGLRPVDGQRRRDVR